MEEHKHLFRKRETITLEKLEEIFSSIYATLPFDENDILEKDIVLICREKRNDDVDFDVDSVPKSETKDFEIKSYIKMDEKTKKKIDAICSYICKKSD